MKKKLDYEIRLLACGVAVFLLIVSAGCTSSEKRLDRVCSVPPIETESTLSDETGSTTGALPQEEISCFVHIVMWPGETVSIIAAWYTGDGNNWKELAEVNPGMDPGLIYEGNRILVPENLMTTRDPMTKEFVDSFYPKAKAEGSGAASEPEEEILHGGPVVDLFGPR